MDEPAAMSSTELVGDLFRREYAHLVSALTRVLGPSNIPLAEDVVHDALLSAMHAWRFGLPRDPKAWIIRAAHNRAIDIIRREQRHRSLLPALASTAALTDTIEAALAPSVDRLPDLEVRRTSVLQALYLLFSEGYHGSNPRDPVRPLLCGDALRLTELLLEVTATTHADVHALAALFCFDTARLATRVDEQGVFV